MALTSEKTTNVQAIMNTSEPASNATEMMHPDLKGFLDRGDVSNEALDDFLMSVLSPLIEPGALTFLWRGYADNTQLLRWIHAGVDRQDFTRVADCDLWHLRIQVPDDGRFEYKLNIAGHNSEHWILDPMNPHRAGDPFGENSVAMTFGYERPAWSVERLSPRGTIDTIDVDSAVFGEIRAEKVYLPDGYDPTLRYPLVVIHDGGDYDDYADLTISLDNLIAAEDIPPLIAVMIQSGDRMSEYPKGRRHARFVVGELLPALTERYTISEDPADRVLLGASLGAVASLATAFRFPGVFGGLILKSGSFVLDPEKLRQRTHPVFHRVAALVQAMRRAPTLPATRAFVSTGELEGLADDNRELAEFLRNHGIDVLFKSSWDGHHWHNWRDQLRDALMWVLRQDRNDVR